MFPLTKIALKNYSSNPNPPNSTQFPQKLSKKYFFFWKWNKESSGECIHAMIRVSSSSEPLSAHLKFDRVLLNKREVVANVIGYKCSCCLECVSFWWHAESVYRVVCKQQKVFSKQKFSSQLNNEERTKRR